MSRVYGDSTPFPHDIDYIHMLRDGIECTVRLLSAEHSIRAAQQRAEAAQQRMQVQATELNALFEQVQSVTTRSITDGGDRTVRTAAQIVAGARGVVDAAIRELESQVAVEVGQSRHIVEKARETTSNAIDQYLAEHAAPESRLSLQLMANPETNVGQVTLITPYGISAVFGVAMPANHAWSKPRRVAELLPQLELHMPKESGWLSKRVEMAPVRLERHFISDVLFGERSGLLRLRKAAAAGSGYQLRVDLENGVNLSIIPVRDDGSVAEGNPLVLEGNDQATMLGLWQGVVASSWDLLGQRGRLLSATFEDQPLASLDSPRVVAEALIANMAPTVVEISRRSGAPGELVLRRNLGEGRREETYSTHAELLEKILVLPPDLRAVFLPLNLSGPLTSARAPSSLPEGLSELEEARADRKAGRLSLSSLVPGLVMSQVATASALPHPSRPPSVPPPENSPPGE
jgi:hypothetical protein